MAESINTISQVTVKYSDYHSMDKVVVDLDDEMTPNPDEREILILE